MVLIVLCGIVQVNGDVFVCDVEMVLLDFIGSYVIIEVNNDVVLLLFSGELIDELIIGYGLFVMNLQE